MKEKKKKEKMETEKKKEARLVIGLDEFIFPQLPPGYLLFTQLTQIMKQIQSWSPTTSSSSSL